MISLNSYESYFLHEENTTQISIDVSRKLPIAPWTELFLKTEILLDANIIRVHRVFCEDYKYKIRENLLLVVGPTAMIYDTIIGHWWPYSLPWQNNNLFFIKECIFDLLYNIIKISWKIC
jgi:hypothetical protein